MIKYAIHFKRAIYFYKNERLRVRAKCVDGYPFHCHYNQEEKFKCFQLVNLNIGAIVSIN